MGMGQQAQGVVTTMRTVAFTQEAFLMGSHLGGQAPLAWKLSPSLPPANKWATAEKAGLPAERGQREPRAPSSEGSGPGVCVWRFLRPYPQPLL